MTVHHPQLPLAVPNQWDRFRAQIAKTLFGAVVEEIPLTAAHFGQANAHLGGLQPLHSHLEQLEAVVGIRNAVVLSGMQWLGGGMLGPLSLDRPGSERYGPPISSIPICTTPTVWAIGRLPQGKAVTEKV